MKQWFLLVASFQTNASYKELLPSCVCWMIHNLGVSLCFFGGDMRHPSASPNCAVAASDASGVFNKNKGGISASLGSEDKHQARSTPKRWGWLWQDGREHFGG